MSCLTALGPVSVSVWAVRVSQGMKGLFALGVDEPLVRVGGGPEESRFIDILMWIVSFDLFNNLLIYHHHSRSLKHSDSISGSALCRKLCFLDIFCLFVSFPHHCGLWISLTKQTRLTRAVSSHLSTPWCWMISNFPFKVRNLWYCGSHSNHSFNLCDTWQFSCWGPKTKRVVASDTFGIQILILFNY